MRVSQAAALATPFLFVLAAPAADAPAAPAPAAPDPNKAEGRFKNIQVLKGYAADDVIPAMQFISNALGVDCEFCHVDHAPEKDDKEEKVAARKMIAMTFAINRDNFDGHREVTCMSCHHGVTHPVGIPVIPADDEPETKVAETKPVDLPAASVVLDKYTQALGGAEAIAKITTRVQKGKLSGFGPEPVPVYVSSKAPNERLTIVRSERGDNITAFDGHDGWLQNGGRPPRDMSAAESDAARLDATLLFRSDLKQLFKTFKVVSIKKVDGQDTVKVVARNEGSPRVVFWFDAQSGLVSRLMRYVDTPLGLNPTQIDYADYRTANGVMVPFRWTVARPGGRFTVQIDESQDNVPLDDKTFLKPSPQAPS